MESGTKAVGTIATVRDTGMTVNDNPRVTMIFRIEPLDGTAPFEAEKQSTVPRVSRAGTQQPCSFMPSAVCSATSSKSRPAARGVLVCSRSTCGK